MNYYQLTELAFRAWFANFVTVAAANDVALGLGLPEVAALQSAQTNYAASVAAYTAAHDSAKAATTTKNDAYRSAFELVQLWANQWQENPAISDALKQELGLNLHASGPSPIPIFPVTDLTVTGNVVGTVKLRWNANGNKYGCNYFVQTRPVGSSEWTIKTVTQRTRLAIGDMPLVPTEVRIITERRGIFSEPTQTEVVYAETTSTPTLTLMEDAA